MYKRQNIIKSNDRKNTCYYIKIFEIFLKYYEYKLMKWACLKLHIKSEPKNHKHTKASFKC